MGAIIGSLFPFGVCSVDGVYRALKYAFNGSWKIFSTTFLVPIYILVTLLNWLKTIILFVFSTEISIITYLRTGLLFFINCFAKDGEALLKSIETNVFKRFQGFTSSLKTRSSVGEKRNFLFKCCGYLYNGILSLLESILSLLSSSDEVVAKVFSLLYSLFWLSIFYLLWYFVGAPTLLAAQSLSLFTSNVGVAVDGFIAFGNILIGFFSYLILIFNSFSPFSNLLAGFTIKGVFLFLLNETLQTLQISRELGERGRRGLIEEDNPIFSDTTEDGFMIAQQVLNGILLAPMGVVAVILTTMEAIFHAVSGFIFEVVKFIQGIFDPAQFFSIGCCFTTAGGFGCCVRNLIQAVVAILGITLPKCTSAGMDGASCRCSVTYGGPFDIGIGTCAKPQFFCATDVASGIWTETKQVQSVIGLNFPTITVSATGKSKQVVCKNFLRQEKRAGRKLDTEFAEADCVNYCITEGGDSWLFLKCKNTIALQSDTCSGRRLEGELWKAHLEKYKFKNPHHEIAPFKDLAITSITPQVKITKEEFLEKIKSVEQNEYSNLEIECKPETGKLFEDQFYRASCIVLKLIADGAVKFGSSSSIQSSLLFKQAQTVHRVLQENATMPYLLDEIADTHNDHFQETIIFNGHRRLFDSLEESKGIARRRIEETVERMRSLQVAEGVPLNTDKYLCPDGITYTPLTEKCTCKMPTATQFGNIATVIRYFFYSISCVEYNLDPRELIVGITSCWQTLSENPEKDPTLIANIVQLISGQKTWEDMIVCFPIAAPISYPQIIVWDWRKFITQSCQPTVGPERTEYHCICTQYPTSGIFNYNTMCATFIGEFECARLYGTWIWFQFLITKIPFFNVFMNTVWQSFWGVVQISTAPGWIFAFDPTYAAYGQSEGTNFFCFLLHLGLPLWFFTFFLGPGWIFYSHLYSPLLALTKNVFKVVLKRPLLGCVNFCLMKNRIERFKQDPRNRKKKEEAEEDERERAEIEFKAQKARRDAEKLIEFIKGSPESV
jgi:hypothetical protein